MLSSQTSKNTYTGNGTVDTYAYSFKIFDDDDLLVTVRDTSGVETTLTKTTHYTVTGVGVTAGGNVALVNGAFDWIDGDGDLKTNYKLTIRRRPGLTQGTDLRNQGSYYPEDIEDQLDKLVMIDQRQQDEIDRSVKLPETVTTSEFSPTLPADIVTNGANSVPLLNSTGSGFADADDWPTASEISGASASASAAAASATAAATSATDADTSADLAADWATKITGQVAATDYSAKAWAIGGTGVTDTASRGAAKEWATETASTVDGTDYSAKEWAKGTQTRGAASGGSAKDWANYTGGTVDNSEYSAKKYAQDAAASLASAFFRDVVYLTSASSPVTLDSTYNGKLLVFDSSGGAISVTLPQMSGISLPYNVAALVKTAGNDITFSRSGTDTIMGATTKVLSVANTGCQFVADTDATPDDWSVIEFGTVGDGTVTEAKLANLAVTSGKIASSAVTDAKTSFTAPTVQRFTSGSGTYTRPSAQVKWIRVKMVGGGGGGGGSGSAAGTAATDGGNSTFDSTLLVAGGGSKGAYDSDGGAGGTNSTTGGTVVVNVAGGRGQGSMRQGSATSTASIRPSGGQGGASAFGGTGGGGSAGTSGAGQAAPANTGGGGGGAYVGQLNSGCSGSGGGAGGYLEAIITNPNSTYSYSVGAGGTGQLAGTSGFAGGDGASGVIIVEEYYQ